MVNLPYYFLGIKKPLIVYGLSHLSHDLDDPVEMLIDSLSYGFLWVSTIQGLVSPILLMRMVAKSESPVGGSKNMRMGQLRCLI